MSDSTRCDPTTTVRNLTRHAVVVLDDDRVLASFPPSGQEARLRERVGTRPAVTLDEVAIPTVSVAYESIVDGLPPYQEGTVLVVSRVLAAAVSRTDLYFPHEEVRNATGGIIGCRALGQFVGGSAADRSTTEGSRA